MAVSTELLPLTVTPASAMRRAAWVAWLCLSMLFAQAMGLQHGIAHGGQLHSAHGLDHDHDAEHDPSHADGGSVWGTHQAGDGTCVALDAASGAMGLASHYVGPALALPVAILFSALPLPRTASRCITPPARAPPALI